MRHNPVKFPQASLIENAKERYYTDGTRKYISVTQLLKSHFPKPFLDEWKERVGEEEASFVSAVSTTRGKLMHKAIEEYIDYYDIVPESLLKMPFNRELFFKFKKRIDSHLTEVNGIEQPLISPKWNIGGTADLIGHWNDIGSIIDHKTSKYDKEISEIEDYFVQKTIYSLIVEETTGLCYKQLVSLIGVDHSNEAQVHIQHRDQYERKALEILSAER